MPTIISFISQKGGVLKSTLARLIAREAAAAGWTVKIADLDTQQGTSTEWARRRLAAGWEPIFEVSPAQTSAMALKNAAHADLLVIDAPARASEGTLEIARASSIVVQPTSGSLDDLHPAVLTFHDLVKRGIPKERLAFALTHIGTEAEERDARDYLERAGYDVLPGWIPTRPAYKQAQNAGRTINETAYKQLNDKATELARAIADKIGAAEGGTDKPSDSAA
jgi:chromosome partitioning protein